MERRERFRWLLVEFAVIVLGVLSALFVDTWIDERQDAERAAVYRERLVFDLQRDISGLDGVIRYYGNIREHGLMVLADLEGDARLDDFALMFSAFNAAEEWGFVLESATFSDMQSTGGLSLIEDVPLRLALAEYHRIGASRGNVWGLPRDYREVARGIIPNTLQTAIHERCQEEAFAAEFLTVEASEGAAFSAASEPLTASAGGRGVCGLDPIDFDVARAVAALRADTEIRRLLRFRMSEVRVAIALFAGQRVMAEDLLLRLDTD
jgi:hypothetical protein